MAGREEYRCSACHAWQPMQRRVDGIVVPMLGARELTMGEARPARWVRVPQCRARIHELCDACDDVGADGVCLACLRAAGRRAFADGDGTAYEERA